MRIPAGYDPAMPLKQAAKRFGVTPGAAAKWRKASGYTTPEREDLWTDADIHRLKHLYSGTSLDDIAATLGRSVSSVKSKAVKLGLRRATGHFAPDRAPQIRGRVTGIADMAQQHLQRFAPCFRCDEDGAANPKGKFFRFGVVLSEDEMMERAERKGWNPHAWKELT